MEQTPEELEEEQREIQSLQNAYQATYEVYQRAATANKSLQLSAIFCVAAIADFISGNPATSMLVSDPGTAAFTSMVAAQLAAMYGAYQSRVRLMILKNMFNGASEEMDSHAQAHLRDIDREFSEVVPMGLNDFNPMQQWENGNRHGVIAGVSALFFLPPIQGLFTGAFAMSGAADYFRNQRLQQLAWNAKEEMEKVHGAEKLIPQQTGPAEQDPPAPQV